ncbi:MAG TPA: DUF899 family protein [Actinomycetota bacterium]
MSDTPVLDIPASDSYQAHRQRLLDAEQRLRDQREQVAELRRALPPGPVIDTDYVFREGDPDLNVESADSERDTRLPDLFAPDGTIRLSYAGSPYYGKDEYRGIDLLSPVWHLLDLLPTGRGDWMPSDGH